MPPPAGAGRCWYWAAKLVSPMAGADALEDFERLARRGDRAPANTRALSVLGFVVFPLIRRRARPCRNYV